MVDLIEHELKVLSHILAPIPSKIARNVYLKLQQELFSIREKEKKEQPIASKKIVENV